MNRTGIVLGLAVCLTGPAAHARPEIGSAQAAALAAREEGTLPALHQEAFAAAPPAFYAHRILPSDNALKTLIPRPPVKRVGKIAPNKLSRAASLDLIRTDRDPNWLTAEAMVHRSLWDLVNQNQDELGHGQHFRKILEGDLSKKQVALTFDDGPHPAYTPKILRILKQYHARATFFVVGAQAQKYPQLIRAEIAAGSSVGNHTYDHVSLIKIPPAYVGTEIKACGQVIQQITGRAPHLFRPPGGTYDPAVAQMAEALGYTTVLWTDDPGDYASPGADVIYDRTLARVNNGAIILLHDGISQTIQMLPRLLQYLRANGYEIVTVDEMLRQQRLPAAPLRLSDR